MSFFQGGHIEGIDFNAEGKLSAMIDTGGVCLISNINTDEYLFHLKLELKQQNPGIFLN